MVSSLARRITESFYAWEVRGRGWDIAPYPVALEPPYRPCLLLPETDPHPGQFDDGRRPTFLSSLVEFTRELFVPAAAITREESEPFEEPAPHPAYTEGELTVFRVTLPRDFASSSDTAGFLVRALSAAQQPVSVEFVGTHDAIVLQVSCREPDAEHVRSSLEGYVPEAGISVTDDALTALHQGEGVVIDFGLADECFLPLATFSSFKIDPYIALMNGLGRAAGDEVIALQVLFERTGNPWGKAIHEALTLDDGSALFADAPEFLPLAREKTRSPLFACVLRVAASAETESRAFDLARGIGAFVLQFSRPGSNALLPLENDGYVDDLHRAAFIDRTSYRSGFLISADELIGLVHLPDASVRQAKFLREVKRSKALPDEAKGEGFCLGENRHRGVVTLAGLSPSARLQHVHVIGASGTGKSTLLIQLIEQDLQAGNGLAVLDAHGDLIDDVLARVPDERLADVVLFDPADEAFPIGLNVFSAKTILEKELLASDLVSIFERLSTSWGDSMGAVLSNAVLAMLEHKDGATLVDLRRFLVDEAFRKDFLKGVTDEEVQFFWTKGFSLIGTRSIGPILTRLDAFLRPKLIRHIVGQQTPRLDLGHVLSEGKIFLGKLAQGLIGEENASVLGSLLATRFHQLALARQQISKAERRPFFLYADEAQHFVTPSMTALLTDVRKYGFGLVFSHQNLFQIRGTPVESALLGNAYTRIAFRVGDEDAKKLAEGYSFFEASDFRSLGRGEALVRLGSAEHDFNLKTLSLRDIDPEEVNHRREAIVTASRAAFGIPVDEVKRDLSRGLSPPEPDREELSSAAPPIAPTRPEASPVPAPAPRRSPPKDMPSVLPTLGRGGPEHKYLQHLVKRLAEERGFKATIEEPLSGGSVDVLLRREKLAIAVEVSITTEEEHELGNVEKCLKGGIEHIALLVPDTKRRIRYAKRAKEAGLPASVRLIAPEEVAEYLDEFTAAMPTEAIVRGYKVRVSRQSLSPEEAAERRRQIAQTIARSLGRAER